MAKKAKRTKQGNGRKSVPLNPITFLVAAIQGIEQHNTEVAREAGDLDKERRFVWVHQTYTPLSREGEEKRDSLRSLFQQAVDGDMLKFPRNILAAASKLDYGKSVALFVATVQTAVKEGIIEQRSVRHGYSLAVRKDWEAEQERRGVSKASRKKSRSKTEAKADVLSQLA